MFLDKTCSSKFTVIFYKAYRRKFSEFQYSFFHKLNVKLENQIFLD